MSTELHDVAGVFSSLLSDASVMNGIGSIVFTKSDGTVGKVFLKQGNVYAIDHISYEHNLWIQLKFEEKLNHGNLRSLIRSSRSQRDSLYRLLRKARTRNPEVTNGVKEYMLGAIDDIYQWKQVKVEWRLGDTFEYEAATIADVPLGRLITVIINRATYKYQKYEAWGFKNDEQFWFGSVVLDINNGEKLNYSPASKLEELLITAVHFIIKVAQEGTGYSLFSIISTIDALTENYPVLVENPAGRQHPPTLTIPEGVSIISGKAHFSENDEDENVQKSFNIEYQVPEPAHLNTQETFNQPTEVTVEETEALHSYDNIINDTTSLEISQILPPLVAKKETVNSTRQTIPKDVLLKEYASQKEIEDLYSDETSSPDKKEVEEESSDENTNTSPLDESPNMAETLSLSPEKDKKIMTSLNPAGAIDLLGLIKQLKEGLQAKKESIDDIAANVVQKEEALREARKNSVRVEDELGQLLLAKETATSDYEQALSVINSLK